MQKGRPSIEDGKEEEKTDRRIRLYYFSLSEQPKHTRDITSILLAQKERLDSAYIESWAGRQGLSKLWKKMRGLAARDE